MDRNERFTRLWTQAEPVLFSYIGSMIPDFHEAEDVLQGVAVRLQQNFDQYDPARPFTGWALRFAHNDVLMSRRSHARSFITYDSEIMDSVTSVYEEISSELERRTSVLRECLRGVKNQHARQVLELRYVDDLPGEEIASRLKMTHGAVRVMLHRLRRLLKSCIERKLLPLGGKP